MGVARLLRGLYGSEPQIDIEQQWARVRVPAPVTFDFVTLDEGFEKNNYAIEGIRLRLEVEMGDGRATVPATGQSFPLRGEPPGEPGVPGERGAARRWLRVLDWKDPAKTAVEIETAADGGTDAGPGAAPESPAEGPR